MNKCAYLKDEARELLERVPRVHLASMQTHPHLTWLSARPGVVCAHVGFATSAADPELRDFRATLERYCPPRVVMHACQCLVQ